MGKIRTRSKPTTIVNKPFELKDKITTFPLLTQHKPSKSKKNTLIDIAVKQITTRGKDEIYDMYEELDLDSFMHVDDFKDTLASGDDEMDENNGIEDITCEAEIENDDNEIKTDIDEACQSETQLSKIELFDESEGKEIVDDFDVSAWLKYDISQPLLRALKVLKFKIPTEIQDRCLPIALNSKRNIIGVAETGSGKTLAFGLPIIQSLINRTEKKGACSLIIAPTRELALQIAQHLKKLAQFTQFHVITIVGGLSQVKQERQLSMKPDVIIGTPGRLWELISSNLVYMDYVKHVEYLVIDEADRMLESGHFRELESILNVVRPEDMSSSRKCYLFSATLINDGRIKMKLDPEKGIMRQGPSLDDLVARLKMKPKDTVHINVLGKTTLLSKTVVELKIECLVKDKDMYLFYLLTQTPQKTLIFMNSIDGIRRLVPLLTLLGIKCFALHADLQQKQRLKNLDRFAAEENAVLVASDVAARGLDVDDIGLVVHYQVPRTVDVYIHRSGRTARAGNEGLSIVMVAPEELKLFKKICMVLKKDGLNEYSVDRVLLAEIQKRVLLARKINDQEHKTQKTKYDRSWMVKTAEDADIMYSGEESEDEEIKIQDHSKLRNQKVVLKQMLSIQLLPSRVKKSFYSGAEGAIDSILKL